MKYNMTFKCGHTTEANLFGAESDRTAKIEKAKSQLCPDCWKRQQSEAAAQANANRAMAPLSGSEKQIAWAEKIRAQFFTEIESKSGNAEGKIAEFIEWMRGQADARYWIDNRNESLRNMFAAWNR